MQAIPIPAALAASGTDPGAAVRQAQPAPRRDRTARDKSFESVIADSFRTGMTDTIRKALGLPKDAKGVNAAIDTGGDTEDSVAAGYGCVLFAIQPPQTDQLILEEVNDLVDQVTLCLESKQPYAEIIEPLLNRLNELLGQLETPLAENRLPLAQEIMARMPQVTEQVPTDNLIQDFSRIAQAAGIEPCPLESEDDMILITQEAKTNAAEPVAEGASALIRTAEEAREPSGADAQASGEDAEKEATNVARPQDQVQKPRTRDATDTAVHDFTPKAIDIKAEQVAAGEQLQAQPTVTATRETLFDTMVENISMDISEAGQTVSIQLKPDFLGNVTIELTMNEGQLQARIRADDHSVRDLISSQVNTLIQSLTDKGIKVEAMEVIYTGVEQGFRQSDTGKGDGFRQEDRNKPPAAQKIAAPGGIEEIAEPLPTQVTDTEVSSVEYRV